MIKTNISRSNMDPLQSSIRNFQVLRESQSSAGLKRVLSHPRQNDKSYTVEELQRADGQIYRIPRDPRALGARKLPEEKYNPDKDLYNFLATPGVIKIGDTVRVKRFVDQCRDTVFLYRSNKRIMQPTKITFPSYIIGSIISYLEDIKLKVYKNPNNEMTFPGLFHVVPSYELAKNKDFFWLEGPYTFHVNDTIFWMKPFMSEHGNMQFRLWNKLDDIAYRYHADGSVWKGPMTSLNYSVIEKLKEAFIILQAQGPERLFPLIQDQTVPENLHQYQQNTKMLLLMMGPVREQGGLM